jgi:hypothetical protein
VLAEPQHYNLLWRRFDPNAAIGVSMTAKVLVEELMNSLLPVAHQMLAEHREFYPYGGYMDRDGRITHVGVKDPETDYPKSADMIDALETTFRELAGEGKCRATQSYAMYA